MQTREYEELMINLKHEYTENKKSRKHCTKITLYSTAKSHKFRVRLIFILKFRQIPLSF